jgi:hypothetical protein
VYFALSKWYGCNKCIERKVIKYKTNGSKPLTSSINTSERLTKQLGDLTYELEIYPKFLYFEKIADNGDKPHYRAIVNQKIDSNYVKKMNS